MAKRKKIGIQHNNKFLKLVISFGLVLGTGLAGGVVVARSFIDNWYLSLIKPSFTPPNWVFGSIWILLYFLIAVSLYITWTAKKHSWFALICFTLNLILNFLWTLLFFGLHDLRIALYEIVLLWLTIIIMIVKFTWVDKRASYVLIPYLVWVSFAMLLNYAIMILNAG